MTFFVLALHCNEAISLSICNMQYPSCRLSLSAGIMVAKDPWLCFPILLSIEVYLYPLKVFIDNNNKQNLL